MNILIPFHDIQTDPPRSHNDNVMVKGPTMLFCILRAEKGAPGPMISNVAASQGIMRDRRIWSFRALASFRLATRAPSCQNGRQGCGRQIDMAWHGTDRFG